MRKRMPAARAVLFCVSAGRGGKLEQLFYQARPQDRGLGASKSENLTAERALAGRPEEFLKRALKRLYEKRNPAKRHGRDARGKGRGATPVLRRLCAKGAAQNEQSLVTPLFTREEAIRAEGDALVAKSGGIGLFFNAFFSGRTLTPQEADQLQALIDQSRKEEET